MMKRKELVFQGCVEDWRIEEITGTFDDLFKWGKTICGSNLVHATVSTDITDSADWLV